MNWTYKNIVIEVNPENGRFGFTLPGHKYEEWPSLDNAKEVIDRALKDYYTIKKEDIKKLLGKLDKREKEFVKALIEEIKKHEFNAYCELGVEMDFIIEE